MLDWLVASLCNMTEKGQFSSYYDKIGGNPAFIDGWQNRTLNQRVLGSSPSASTKPLSFVIAGHIDCAPFGELVE